MNISERQIAFLNFFVIFHASIAQGLEHWSCKPGVESSNLSGGFSIRIPKDVKCVLAFS